MFYTIRQWCLCSCPSPRLYIPPASWASITTGPGGSAVAVVCGLPWSVWVTLVKEQPCQDLLMDTWDPVLHYSSVVPIYLPLPTPLHPTCRLSLYQHPCQIFLVYLRAVEALQWLWRAVYHKVYGWRWRWSKNYLAKTLKLIDVEMCFTPSVSGDLVRHLELVVREPICVMCVMCVMCGCVGWIPGLVSRVYEWCRPRNIAKTLKWIHETMFDTIRQWWPC